MNNSKYVLDHDQVKEIRHALLIGLDCYGQIEQLVNARDVSEELCGEKVPEALRALHPTGTSDVASLFAAALRDLEYSEQPGAA